MAYVKRDARGTIVAVYAEPVEAGLQEIADDDPDLQTFLAFSQMSSGSKLEWLESDLSLARVLEDLIDVLIEKKVILFTDFPEGAQKKLLARRGLRKEFSYVESLFGEDEAGFGDAGDEGFL